MELDNYKTIRNDRIKEMYNTQHSVNEISHRLGIERNVVVKILGSLVESVPKIKEKHKYEFKINEII